MPLVLGQQAVGTSVSWTWPPIGSNFTYVQSEIQDFFFGQQYLMFSFLPMKPQEQLWVQLAGIELSAPTRAVVLAAAHRFLLGRWPCLTCEASKSCLAHSFWGKSTQFLQDIPSQKRGLALSAAAGAVWSLWCRGGTGRTFRSCQSRPLRRFSLLCPCFNSHHPAGTERAGFLLDEMKLRKCAPGAHPVGCGCSVPGPAPSRALVPAWPSLCAASQRFTSRPEPAAFEVFE